MGCFLGKNGKREPFVVLSLCECNNLGLTSYESNSVKINFPVSAQDASTILGSQRKKQNYVRVILHPFAEMPSLGRLI